MNMERASPASRRGGLRQERAFVHTHVVSFEETNLVGNVYFVRHVAWQGRCREMFLKEHAPTILDELERDLRLVTLTVSCTYFDELRAFDEVVIRMSQAYQRQHRIGLCFDYRVERAGEPRQAARGFQEVACMRISAGVLAPCPVPRPLADALARYVNGEEAQGGLAGAPERSRA
jgi:enediyne biosynthesis thioesterase